MATVLVGVDILLYHHPMVTKRATATLMDPVWAPAFRFDGRRTVYELA